MKGEAGGRGWGSNGETPTEEGLSYFMRKKTNKQTKRSKEKGNKGNHGAFSKEPKTAISASWGVGKCSFVLMKGLEAYVDAPPQNTHTNQMPLDWLQKARSGGVHSACWLPAEMRAAPKTTAILRKSSSWHGAGALAIRD